MRLNVIPLPVSHPETRETLKLVMEPRGFMGDSTFHVYGGLVKRGTGVKRAPAGSFTGFQGVSPT
jgi:hypothetical protein